MGISRKSANALAGLILVLMFLLLVGSAAGDSATMDELAHIPAGYSYVTQGDYRLNPEHPPLLKALSGLSAWVFVRPYFPTDTTFWRDDVNGQWAQGAAFLYESGNDPDKVIFWSRFPLILLAILFGWLLFRWVRDKFGNAAALLTVVLFAFSPTVLAHARYVTTDLGAAFGFFIGLTAFLRFLEHPSRRTILLAGLALGLVLLLKFSLILLLPIYAILLVAWVRSRPNLHLHERARVLSRLAGRSILIGAVALALVWVVYAPLVVNYPAARQLRDTEFILGSFPSRQLAEVNIWLVKNPVTRPIGHYLLGFLMVSQRAGGGNTSYYLGSVSAEGSRNYFPLLYSLKEPLAYHLLSLIALIFAIWKILRRRQNSLRAWLENHFVEFSSLVFIVFYWLTSVASPLNIGVRHVLPTFPFLYLLVARQITGWVRPYIPSDPQTLVAAIHSAYSRTIGMLPRLLAVGILLLWQVVSVGSIFPHFLAYYNELAGGTRNGYRIAVDSNYDWGQDLKRLRSFAQRNGIEKIAVDYFGGGSPRYVLGSKFDPWWSAKGVPHGWFAISATFRQGGFGVPVPGFERKLEDSYPWLRPYQPVARAGYSIFIYHLP